MDQASPFRKATLGEHAAIMDTLRKEHVTTNVTLGWELVEHTRNSKAERRRSCECAAGFNAATQK